MVFWALMLQEVMALNNVWVIAGKEWRDIIRSRVFMYIAILLALLTITSLIVSYLVFGSQVAEYQKSANVLRQLGKDVSTSPPQLYPLNLLRGVVDYVEIIGGVVGILLGYISVSKERNTQAFKLLLARPITLGEIILGKIAGNFLFITAMMILVSLAIALTTYLIGGVMLTASDLVKIALFAILSSVYVMFFFMLSFFLSLRQKTVAHALIMSFIVWLVVVLLLPQIGDTMDPDNQIPGGFFQSMSLDKTGEKQVMAQFQSYETIRDGIEQLSITKHYERTVFAIFGIKKAYNSWSLTSVLWDSIWNIIWIISFAAAGLFADYRLLSKNKNIIGG